MDRSFLPLVGGKNASLGEMIKAGIPVPPGFAVTTRAYQEFVAQEGMDKAIMEALKGLDPEDTGRLLEASEKARQMIRETPMPEAIEESIRGQYERLCRACNREPVPVAVRSSATAEDLPTASFAGQQETYLWVQGKEEVSRRVKDCWASLYTPRAVSYRIRNRFPHEKVLISVGVQKMVNSRTAGVMFTLNPTNGDPSKVVIEGSWGLGETVVSGTVNPDKFVVDKVILEIGERHLSAKHVECVFDPAQGKVVEAEVELERQKQCCLEDREIRGLVEMGKSIERHYGCPMDIEWAIDADLAYPESLFIVQARPETVWSQKKKSVLGRKSGFDLLMERAMTRIKIPR